MATTHHEAELDEYNVYPPHHGMSPGRYLATRISSLKPPMNKAPNPIRLLRMLNRQHWGFFAIAFCAWVSRWCKRLQAAGILTANLVSRLGMLSTSSPSR